jgi:hypothetical protein
MKHQRGEIAPLCPSAQPDWEGSVAIGVVSGTAAEPRVTHFPDSVPVDEGLLALTEPVTPAEVLRFAAPCLCTGCMHFEGETCQLARRVVRVLAPVTTRLPKCSIRPRCRWFQQEGRAACARCPQIVTDNHNPSAEMRAAAYGTGQAEG